MTTNLRDNSAAAVAKSPFLYPVALDVTGRVCIVVGGGTVGERKARALASAGARVVVVAPDANLGVQACAADGVFDWIAKPFVAPLLNVWDAVFLLIAATDQPAVNALVRDAARDRRILFNAAAPLGDEADNDDSGGDFATMATMQRGDLLVAVTTGGAGPALAARLKRALSDQFGPEWEPYVGLIARARRHAKAHIPEPSARAEALRRVANSESVFALVASGDVDGAQQEAMRCLLP